MPLVFNPFNPMSYVNAWTNSVTSADLGRARVSTNTPVPVEVKSTGSGIKTTVKQVGAATEVSFSGKAKKPTSHDVFGGALSSYVEHHPISLGVAVAEAPTKDAFGRSMPGRATRIGQWMPGNEVVARLSLWTAARVVPPSAHRT